MTLLDLASVAALGTGLVFLLGELPWFRDRPLAERVRIYAGAPDVRTARVHAGVGIRQVLAPLVQDLGSRLSRALGAPGDLALRLERAGRHDDVEEFRLRQFTHGLCALVAGLAAVMGLGAGLAVTISIVLGAPALAVLAHEQAISSAVETRRRRLRGELPVVVEQLGLLISAGHSVTGALTRIASRSNGVVADDLRRVLLRIRHGLADQAALAEWAQRCDVDAVSRLAAILALHGQTADLGLLIADEARSVRAEAHRELLETIERRAQLVWIPVTVATLVPGLIFLAVPFMSAMSQVTGS